MVKNIVIELKSKHSEVLCEKFIEWFKSSGEFKFLDFVDMVEPNLDYSDLKTEISSCNKVI